MKLSPALRTAVKNRDGNRCRNCGSTTELVIDHHLPISAGGGNSIDNLRTLCNRCNSSKGATVPQEFRGNPEVLRATRAQFESGRCPYENTAFAGTAKVEDVDGKVYTEVTCSRCGYRAWRAGGQFYDPKEPFEIAHLRYEIPRTAVRLDDMRARAGQLGLKVGAP